MRQWCCGVISNFAIYSLCSSSSSTLKLMCDCISNNLKVREMCSEATSSLSPFGFSTCKKCPTKDAGRPTNTINKLCMWQNLFSNGHHTATAHPHTHTHIAHKQLRRTHTQTLRVCAGDQFGEETNTKVVHYLLIKHDKLFWSDNKLIHSWNLFT